MCRKREGWWWRWHSFSPSLSKEQKGALIGGGGAPSFSLSKGVRGWHSSVLVALPLPIFLYLYKLESGWPPPGSQE